MRLETFRATKKVLSQNFGNADQFLQGIFGPADGTLRVNEAAPRVPLVILVFGCATVAKYKKELLTIESTWGSDAREREIPVFYFLGEEKTDLQGQQYVYLPGIKDDYQSASHKQFLGYYWILQHYNPDTIYCVGSDTFINIPKLQALARLVNPEAPLLLGNNGFVKQLGPLVADYLSGGGGILTTRETHRRIIYHCGTVVERWISATETFRSDLSCASDVQLCFLSLSKGVTFLRCPHIFHAKYNDVDAIEGPIRADQIVACHNMTPEDFEAFHGLLKANEYFMTEQN
jgi:hypothetical protein